MKPRRVFGPLAAAALFAGMASAQGTGAWLLVQPPIPSGTNEPDMGAPLKNYTLRESFATLEDCSARWQELRKTRATAFPDLPADAQEKLAAGLVCRSATEDSAALEQPLVLTPEAIPS